MDPHELAVIKTVVYADLFDYPLRLEELCRGLFDVALEPAEVRGLLDHSPLLRATLCERDGFVFVHGRDDLPERRRAAELRSAEIVGRHRRALRSIARLPYVRMVALSGAAAFDNVRDDDVDLFLVAARGRAWSVCMLVTLLTRALGVRGSTCANYIVDEGALALSERDFYTAHQAIHLRPLSGGDVHRRFVEANPWAAELFPSAYADALEAEAPPARRSLVERLLSLGPGALLEWASRRVLGANLRRKLPPGVDPGSVRLDPGRLKLHLNDHLSPTIGRFERSLERVLAGADSVAAAPARRRAR